MRPFFLLTVILLIGVSACKKKGCTDSLATNYNPEAKKEDNSCIYDTTSGQISRHNYGSDERQHFDLYLPADHDASTKTVILVHGGAWVLGPNAGDEIETFRGGLGWDLQTPLLDSGYAVAVMKYRLACYETNTAAFTGDPMTYMVDMLADLDAVINYLRDNAGSIGIAPDQFALIGESAGAHIALLYGLRNSSDPDLQTVVSFFAPAMIDDAGFKSNTSSAPYNNLPLTADITIRRSVAACDNVTGGSANLWFALKSLAGFNLETTVEYPAYTDTLSPAYVPNMQRNLPIFLLHGEADDLVPTYQADTLIARIHSVFGTAEGSPADFTSQHKMLTYASCGHGWSGGSCNRTQMIADVMSWMAAHF